jgi:hypothetical protein
MSEDGTAGRYVFAGEFGGVVEDTPGDGSLLKHHSTWMVTLAIKMSDMVT